LTAQLTSGSLSGPLNEVEGALAVQMGQTHALAADLLDWERQADRTDHIALYGNLAVKLSRTFAMQAEALHRIRGGGRQSIEVRHVHINNAVIGAGGGIPEIGNQPLAKPIGDASVATLRGQVEADWQPCQAPRVTGRIRCRMRGRAAGSGAPYCSRNGAWKSGVYSVEMQALRSLVRRVLASE
jgi:hypothetical protein